MEQAKKPHVEVLNSLPLCSFAADTPPPPYQAQNPSSPQSTIENTTSPGPANNNQDSNAMDTSSGPVVPPRHAHSHSSGHSHNPPRTCGESQIPCFSGAVSGLKQGNEFNNYVWSWSSQMFSRLPTQSPSSGVPVCTMSWTTVLGRCSGHRMPVLWWMALQTLPITPTGSVLACCPTSTETPPLRTHAGTLAKVGICGALFIVWNQLNVAVTHRHCFQTH